MMAEESGAFQDENAIMMYVFARLRQHFLMQ